jgi:RNA polymerase sigma factor (sigma-70 family)
MEQNSAAVSRLVAAAAAGDERAWNEIIDRYAPLVMSVLSRHRLFGSDAQDVSQIVWLRLVEHLERLREPRALPMWLITTTRNESLRLLRSNRRAQPVDPLAENPAWEADSSDIAEGLLHAERTQALLEAAGSLSERDRALLRLLLQDPPLSYVEIAGQMGIPVGAIGPTRGRIVRKLRRAPALAALYGSETRGGDQKGGQRDVAAVAG